MPKISPEMISSAAASLMIGNLVAFPTETVYGLGADACNSQSIARIYSVKGRPTDHPLIVHIASKEILEDWAEEVPEFATSLARDYWPGPATLILKRSVLARDFITGGQETVGVRVPAHPVALELLEAFHRLGGRGVAAPSANRYGSVSPTTSSAVADELSNYMSHGDQIIDGGMCDVGLESTIIDCTTEFPRILRPGAVTVAMIEESTGLVVGDAPRVGRNKIRVSGSMVSHYAPNAIVVLDQLPVLGQGFIAMADVATPAGVVRLASPKTHEEFARILYAALRSADEQELQTVVVFQPKGNGIAIAIQDRLKRASYSSLQS
jgi:L-threonylcarbamoyladenylate synthase